MRLFVPLLSLLFFLSQVAASIRHLARTPFLQVPISVREDPYVALVLAENAVLTSIQSQE